MLYFLSFLWLTVGTSLPGLNTESFDDSISFRINWGSPQDSILADPNYTKFPMTSSDNEKFECLIPNTSGPSIDENKRYKGPSVIELIFPLIQGKKCALKSDTYWTYELCHGSHIKQYHEDRDGKSARKQEYILGKISLEEIEALHSEMAAQLAKEDSPVNPPQTNVGGLRMPYLAIEYNDGTVCDVTGRPRRTRVQYVCFEDHRNSLYRIKEIYSCEYEVTVLTSYLCDHPAYRPPELSQVNLYCFGQDPDVQRPTKLRDLEFESQQQRLQSDILGKLVDDTVRVKIIDANDEEINMLIDSKSWGSRRADFPEKAPVNTQLIDAFLNGEYCLQGGSGWWHYELCHGKNVRQYHENPDGTKIIIHLGSFDVTKHKEWMTMNTNKRPKAGTEQVSHFYSNGDICEETNRPRQVEVRLKCKEGSSPTAVTLYLLEPKTCEYVLGIESPILCPLIQNADEFGLFKQLETTDIKEKTTEAAESTKVPVQETLEKPTEKPSTKSPQKSKRDPGEL